MTYPSPDHKPNYHVDLYKRLKEIEGPRTISDTEFRFSVDGGNRVDFIVDRFCFDGLTRVIRFSIKGRLSYVKLLVSGRAPPAPYPHPSIFAQNKK